MHSLYAVDEPKPSGEEEEEATKPTRESLL